MASGDIYSDYKKNFLDMAIATTSINSKMHDIVRLLKTLYGVEVTAIGNKVDTKDTYVRVRQGASHFDYSISSLSFQTLSPKEIVNAMTMTWGISMLSSTGEKIEIDEKKDKPIRKRIRYGKWGINMKEL